MTAAQNETSRGSRLHIGIFGKTNSGKSSFMNAFLNQEVSIVADVAGTTTDPVYKAMELHPIGPCVLIDTAGFDDESELGERRVERTQLAAEKADVAVLLFAEEEMEKELSWYHFFQKKGIPVLLLVNKIDILSNADKILEKIKQSTNETALRFSAKTKEGMEDIIKALIRAVPENYGERLITGNLVSEDDLVLLVMPQDIQAPKGRLILPQVQTLRELLDKKCLVMSVTAEKLKDACKVLSKPPKLIITDSQIFAFVHECKPKESMLTSFSVLFAAYKGDLDYYVEGAKTLDALTPDSKVLIAECCTHKPLQEDIGRVKIPNLLKKRVGDGLSVEIVGGCDFPKELGRYDLIIQCGACMFNRSYVMSRVEQAKVQQVPMTNYGVAIAHLTGILSEISMQYQM